MCSPFSDNWAWREPMMQYNNVPCPCPTSATALWIKLMFREVVSSNSLKTIKLTNSSGRIRSCFVLVRGSKMPVVAFVEHVRVVHEVLGF